MQCACEYFQKLCIWTGKGIPCFGRLRFPDLTLEPRQFFHTKTKRLCVHTDRRSVFFFLHVTIRNSLRSNNTGAITNHHFATPPGLQPVHDDDSHKQETPAKSKSIQIVTTNNASSNYSCSRPHQWFRHPTNRYPTSARNTRCPP